MGKRKRVWFKPLQVFNGFSVARDLVQGRPIESSDFFLFPCTWQGWLITAVTGAAGYGAARLAMYLYAIKPEYGFAGWMGFAAVILLYMHIANTFSNRT